VNLQSSPTGFGRTTLETLIASSEASATGSEVTFEPFGLLIAEVNP
jgi:hypothetical protein